MKNIHHIKIENKIYVLAYHEITDKNNFEKQLIFLKTNYNIIEFSDFLQFIKGETNLPRKPLLITFDDGDKSLYDNALPILRKHNIPAIIFIITDLINSDKPYWWDEIVYYLGSDEGSKKVWEVKKWPNFKRKEFIKSLRVNSEKKPLVNSQLTVAQLREMQDTGITIANHSHTHPMFDKCTSEELDKELQESTTILSQFGFSKNLFAYPNGNFSLNSEDMLKKYAIDIAFLFDHIVNSDTINPLRISRLVVNDTTPLWKFRFILSGWHSRILPLTRFAGKITRKFK